MAKIERKYMAHYLDTSFSYVPGTALSGNYSWYRLGEDLDEYNVELNPNITVTQNIHGVDTIVHDYYEISGDAKMFYARTGDAMFVALQNIIDNLRTNKDCFTLALEVQLWSPSGANGFKATMRPCYVVPQSYGGDTSGYQIPFLVYYMNAFATNGIFVPNGAGSGSFITL